MGTIAETPLLSDFSTGKILWFSLLNGRTSSRKGTRSYAKLKIGSKMLCIRDHGLQESRTSPHGKKMVFLSGSRPWARGRLGIGVGTKESFAPPSEPGRQI